VSRIQRLPDALIDQIAAGEVVERPASVVKELVENALDAGAGRIGVEVRAGGAQLVAITDDGCGMDPDQARLALERHATSKLAGFEDLQGIRSFGFRGEGLPAIAWVSRLRLRTRPAGAEGAFGVQIDAGTLVHARPASGPVGTRIEVADLFAAVPARRKFLKTAATEWGHISDWLGRAALARPDVHFDVRRDDRDAFHWPAVDAPLDRIAAVLGEADAAALVESARDQGDIALRAFVSRPDAHRATGNGIHLFVNGRPVRDKVMRHALVQVMRDVLPRGRFPTAVLFLDVLPEAVDVNVHPAKWEVRFADPQTIHRLVTATVRDAMAGREWLGGGAASAGEGGSTGEPARPRWAEPTPGPTRSWTSAGATDWMFAERPDAASETRAPGVEDAEDVASPRPPFRFGDLRLLGQLLGTYLVTETKLGLVLIDQHAAHERILYERLRARWLAGGVARQALLVPTTVEVETRGHAALLGASEALERLGFEVEPFDERTIAIRAVPELLAERDPSGLVRNLADELSEVGEEGALGAAGSRILDAADRLFASMACHSARRAGEVLTDAEQLHLLSDLDTIPWAPTCPHGRPVAVPMDLAEIERRFGRA
jgi:DNA mismatch repair protein MutL